METLLSQLSQLSCSDLQTKLRDILLSMPTIPQINNRQFHFSEPAIQAAVLVPFLTINQEWHLLFIRRAIDHHLHSGQVAFPGGQIEPNDPDPEFTALREAQEEIGLYPQDVTPVGQLPALLTVTNYRIFPIVGIIPYPYPLKPNPLEVTRIFTIPIFWLADKKNYKIVPRSVPPPVGIIQTIYYTPYDGEELWGASAQIVHTLISLLEQETP